MSKDKVGTTSTTEDEVVPTDELESPAQAGEAAEQQLAEDELDPIVAENERLKRQLQSSDRKITELMRSRDRGSDDHMAAQMEYQGRVNELLLQQQRGNIDSDSVDQQLQAAKWDYQAKVTRIQYNQYAREMGGTVEEMLSDAGIETSGENMPAEVGQLRDELAAAARRGDVLEPYLKKAVKIVAAKVKGSGNEDKLKEDIKRELLEERKRSPGLRVETGGATGTGSGRRLTQKELAELDPFDYDKLKKEGKIVI